MCDVENAEVNCAISHGSYIEYREVDPDVAIQERPPWCPLIEISSADVAPVVHGRWIFHDDKPRGFNTECSVCHAEGMVEGYYCPNCGAKMDLVI
jgi:hypothetical protein